MPELRTLIASSVLLAALSGCGGKKSGDPTPTTPPEAGVGPTSIAPSPALPAPTPAAASEPKSAAGATGALAGYIAGLDAIAMALESVKDEASAREAAGIITAVSSRMQGLVTEVDKMPDAGREKALAAAKKEMSHALTRIAAAMFSLGAKPEQLHPVGEAMNTVPKLK